jgi:hypothetical protein
MNDQWRLPRESAADEVVEHRRCQREQAADSADFQRKSAKTFRAGDPKCRRRPERVDCQKY